MENRQQAASEVLNLVVEAILAKINMADPNGMIGINRLLGANHQIPDKFGFLSNQLEFNGESKLDKLKAELKEKMTKDLSGSLTKLKDLMVKNTKTYDEVIMQISNLNDVNEYFRNNQIEFEQVKLEKNQIRSATLFIINSLEESLLLRQ